MSDQSQAKQHFSGWMNLVILTLAYTLMYGVAFYGYSVVFPAMIKTTGWARGDASVAHTIRALIVGFGAPLAVYLMKRFGVRYTMSTGIAICTATLFVLGTIEIKELWLWTLLWGIVMGIGISICGQLVANTSITQWFNKRRALAIAICMAASAVGGAVAQPLFTYVMKEMGSWQYGWLTSAILGVVALIFAFMIKNKPADYGQFPDGIDPEAAKKLVGSERKVLPRTYRATEEWTLTEALRSPALWLILIGYCTVSMSIYIPTAHGVLHLTDLGFTKMQAAYVISLVLIGSLFRLPLAWLADFVEPRHVMSFIFCVLTLSLLAFWKAPSLTFAIAGAMGIGLTFGTGFVLLPTIIANYFTANSFPKLNAFIMPFNVCTAAIVPAGAGYLFQYYKSYNSVFIIMMVLAAISLISTLMLKPPVKKSV